MPTVLFGQVLFTMLLLSEEKRKMPFMLLEQVLFDITQLFAQ